MSGPPGEQGIAADRRWTFEAVESVSRTFALSIELLEEPVASWLCTGYLLCRGADTIEDASSLSPADRAGLLEQYDAMLDPEAGADVGEFASAVAEHRPADAGDDWAALANTDRAMRVFRSFDDAVQASMRGRIREMTTGMAAFLRRHADSGGIRVTTVAELEEYCWYVAGTVGELFTDLLPPESGSDATDADDAFAFALLLQLVNIAKDVRVDYETEGNVYLPGEWLAEEGLDHGAVGDPAATERLARVVERVADRAGSYAAGARRYLRGLPEDEAGVLEAATLPYLLALGTLRELQSRSEEAVAEPATVKLDRAEVEALYGRMSRGVTQSEIDRLSGIVRERSYADTALD